MLGSDQDITKNADLYPEETYKELVEAGVFYGRKKAKTHPQMKPYILLNRNGIEIINLQKTLEGLEKALNFLKERIRSGATVLFAATQPPAQEAVKLAKEFNLPIVNSRWLGGTLTNFKIISKRIEYFKKLKSDLASGAFEKHTKKERLEIQREIDRLMELFGNMENMANRPDLLIIVDPNLHTTAVREARHLKIPVIAYANTDSDPELVDFPVVGNNKARSSINWFLSKIGEAIREAKSLPPILPADAGSFKEQEAPESTSEVSERSGQFVA